jgi:hypothetical protein
MSDSTLLDIVTAIASQLDAQLTPAYDDLQVASKAILSPTPPCLDVYPGDPFGEATTFGDGSEYLFTLRARVTTAEMDGAQELLLSLMDRNGTSVRGALESDRTLGGVVDDLAVEGPSAYQQYPAADGASHGSYLGCEWQVKVVL